MRVGLVGSVFVLAAFAACSSSGDAAPTDGGSGDAGASDGSTSTTSDAGARGTNEGGTTTSDPCSSSDPDRIFSNDFEDGRYYADASAGQTYDPSRDFVDVKPANFGVVDATVMAPHAGSKSLRGNFWQIGTQNPQPDPVAAKAGITILGSKSTGFAVDLSKLAISQTPSSDPSAATPPPGELYVSFWLWYDADFTHQADMSGITITQTVKLFYAFGPNGTEWVVTDGSRFFMNENNLGAWPILPWISPPALEGQWRHVEWYFKSESHPVYYEYGVYSNGSLLASACTPRPADYTMSFPVPGSNPQTCMSETDAYAANSKDGIFRMKIDGDEFYPAQNNIAYDARFARIEFPAYHGGGGEPIASAGWAIDDVCIRKTAPAGF